MSWRRCALGEVSKLHYGKALQGYSPCRDDDSVARVYGTNGPIGWARECLTGAATIVIGRKGAYRGVHYSHGPSWTIDTAFYTEVDHQKVDLKWLYYRLLLVDINGMNAGAAIPSTRREDFYAATILLPGLDKQKQIAEILTTYDDLIENNKNRIALLEESARLLYREWFVRLRFPGYEDVKVFDGVPEGWRLVAISELSTVLRGKSYSSSELVESDGQPFVNLKCIKRFGGFRLSGLKSFKGDHKPHHLLEPGDIVIAVTDMTREAMIVAQAARIPRAVGEGAIYSMDLVKLVPADFVESEWIYGMLRFSPFSSQVREKATGATVLHLQPKHIESWNALVPTTFLRRLYAEHVQTILSQVDNLEVQNGILTKARDLLLPRLMSGEIAT